MLLDKTTLDLMHAVIRYYVTKKMWFSFWEPSETRSSSIKLRGTAECFQQSKHVYRKQLEGKKMVICQ